MPDRRNVPDDQILAGILSNDLNATIRHIYRLYSGVVLAYVAGLGGSQQDGEDVFQDTVIAFIELVKRRKFRGDSSIQTFLVSIARNTWLNESKKRKSLEARGKIFETAREANLDITKDIYQREVKEQFQKLMGRLGGSCKDLLTLIYYEGLSFKEIVDRTHYENEQVVRNKKYKCMKELTELIHENPTLLRTFK